MKLALIIFIFLILLPGVASAADNESMSAGAQMIKDGLEKTIVDNVNDLFAGVGGLQLGELSSNETDNSQVAVFAVAAHTIDPIRDPAMMARLETMRDIYIYAILLFAGILALFLIYQSISPEDSAELMQDFTGTYGYVAASDMAKYFINTCGWLLLGPALFFGTLKINNFLVEGQMLSVLDQVAFSSDSIGLYIVMGLLWLFSIIFFAIRLVMIIISAHVWIMYGLGFAFKKVRWAAILVTTQQIVLILSQFAIIWTCCIVVSYTTSQELAWYSVSFVYLGMFCTVVFLEILFFTWPILWKLLSPTTLKTAIRIMRYV
ncbi:MAG: hypothetical protein PHF13_03705 [Acholeplasmataceae bacterium]|nr:hypothetical protein [Acholeplasmataceae bacterium]